MRMWNSKDQSQKEHTLLFLPFKNGVMKMIRSNKETEIQETYGHIPHNILEEIKFILKTSVHYLKCQRNLVFKLQKITTER